MNGPSLSQPRRPHRLPLTHLLSSLCLCLATLAAPSGAAFAHPAISSSVATPTATIAPPHYRLAVALDPATSTIAGDLELVFTNFTPESLTSLPFRLYPNAAYYGAGNLSVREVTAGGHSAYWTTDETGTVLTISLPKPLARGDATTIALRFTTTVPANSNASFGIFSHDLDPDTWVLSDWYPILAGWDPAAGWVLDPPTTSGDPTFSDTSTYDVSLTLPADLGLVASGDERPAATVGGFTRWHISTGDAREFTFVASPDLEMVTSETNGVAIRGFAAPTSAAAGTMQIAVDDAAAALADFVARYGAYPYNQLDLVDIDLANALGVSWSGILFLNGDVMLNPEAIAADPSRLAFTVAHEVGHQWIGTITGANSNDHAFMVEGLTNYLTLLHIDRTMGRDAANRQLEIQIAGPYRKALVASGDGIADVAAGVETGGPSLGVLIYGKAALGFMAIHQAIGDVAFDDAIATYVARFAAKNATPDDLLETFEHASGQDLTAVWNFWFRDDRATFLDVNELVAWFADRP